MQVKKIQEGVESMTPNLAPTKPIEGIRKDASKLMTDLNELTAKLKEVSKEKFEEKKEVLSQIYEKDLEIMKQKLNTLKQTAQENLKELDKNVHKHTYMYLAGALGLGFVLGKALSFPNEAQY